MPSRPAAPLAGIKVVEICQVAAGPFCGMLLADYGAEVVKVEPPEGDAMRQWPPVNGSYSAAYSIVSMIHRVREGGAGGTIDVPMFATTIAIAALQTSEYFGTGRNPRKLGSAHPRNAPYQAYRARDGWFAIAAGNNKLWQSVCAVVGTPEWLDDPRFASTTLRAALK